jgi:uncharacterized protein YgiM (DUF1202 family)
MKRQKKPISKIWTWVSFVIFGVIIVLLATSLIQKKSPGKVLTTFFSTKKLDSDYNTYTKKDLIDIINRQTVKIDSIESRLNDYIRDFGSGRGRINVNVEALNMRSEPALSGKVIDRIPNGTIVGVLYFDSKEQYLDGATGYWCRIKYAGQEGWVWGNYLIVLE